MINAPTLICYYLWQSKVGEITLYTGAILLGGDLIQHWSRVQNSIALSSGEADFNSVVKGISEALGMMNVLAEMGLDLGVRHFIDALATKGF